MQASEIITQDAHQHGVDPSGVLNFVHQRIQSGKGSILQHGDSILLITHLDQGDAEVHLYTVESPLALVKSLKNFLHILQQTPIQRIYGKADNPGILKMLEMIGLSVQHSDRPEYNWMADIKG